MPEREGLEPEQPARERAGPRRAATEHRPYAVVDLDGVLADVTHRLHHLAHRRKDWDAFFAAADADPLLAEGHAVVTTLADAHALVYLSGRPERLRAVTEGWLRRYDLPPGRLLLRPERDRRPARLFKLGVLRRLARQRTVAVLVDDDAAVCATARAAGFTVLAADWAPPAPTLRDAQERLGRT